MFSKKVRMACRDSLCARSVYIDEHAHWNAVSQNGAPFSYTHMPLPTILRVYLPIVAAEAEKQDHRHTIHLWLES